jgi:heptosyltransferase-2/heptosyltransferase-3
MGDCVMALPAIDALLADADTEAVETWSGPHSRDVFVMRVGNEAAKTCYDTFTWQRAMRVAWRIRRHRYDVHLLLDRSRLLRLAFRAAGVRNTFHIRTRVPESRHEVVAFLDVVRESGYDAPFRPPRFPVGVAERRESNLVVIHPGGAENPGSTMLGKRWPPDRWAKLAATLLAEGFQVRLSGGQRDRDVCRAVAERAGLDVIWDMSAKGTVMETANVIARAALFVGPDTGISHVAAALGTPTVVIFGPTNPHRYRPLGDHVAVCAAPGSWTLADRDLRRTATMPINASTSWISVNDVIDGCRRVVHAGTTG